MDRIAITPRASAIKWLVIILLSGAIFLLGNEFENKSLRFRAVSGYIIPNAHAVKMSSLGFTNFASDIFSVEAVNSLYVADKLDPDYWKEVVRGVKAFLKGGEYEPKNVKLDVVSFSRYAYIASYLDPFDVDRIETFALLMDWGLGFPEGSAPILEYVSRKNTLDWKPPYYLALNYLIHRSDKQRAMYWLKESASRPKAATIVKTFLLDLAIQGDSRENVLSGLASLQEVVKDKDIRKRIDETIQYFKKGGVIKRVDWGKVREETEKLRKKELE